MNENEQIEKHLTKLKDLTIQNKSIEIKDYLNGNICEKGKGVFLTKIEKGKTLEYYLAFLYKVSNFGVVINGGTNDRGVDLIIYGSSKNIIKYIQVKNTKKVQNIDEVLNDFQKFQTKYGRKEEKKFSFFSLNGFTNDIEEKIKGRILLNSFDDIKNIIDNFGKKNFGVNKFESLTQLYPHNFYVYNKLKKDSLNNKKILIIQPTGTGKMYLINQLIEDFYLESEIQKKSIVLAPTNIILNKIKKLSPWTNDKIFYLTYTELLNKKELFFITNKFEYIYLDETHRMEAKLWKNGINKLIKYNKDNMINLYGFTATSDRMDDKNIEINFDCITNKMSLSESIAKGILKSPKYVTSIYSLEKEKENILKLLKNSNLTEKEKEEKNIELNNIIKDWEENESVINILKKHIENEVFYKNKKSSKFIVFCENFEHMDIMEIEVLKWFKNTKLYKNGININKISSNYTEQKNEEQLKKFESETIKDSCDILLCINKLNEGLHVKDISGVIFLRETKSNIIFYQQLGRALSASDSERSIVFDFVNNFSNASNDIDIFFNEIKEKEIEENKKRIEIGFEKNDGINLENIKEYNNVLNKINDIKNIIEKQRLSFNDKIEILTKHLINNEQIIIFNNKEINIKSLILNTKQKYNKKKLSLKEIKEKDIINNKFPNFLEQLRNRGNKNIYIEDFNKIKEFIKINRKFPEKTDDVYEIFKLFLYQCKNGMRKKNMENNFKELENILNNEEKQKIYNKILTNKDNYLAIINYFFTKEEINNNNFIILKNIYEENTKNNKIDYYQIYVEIQKYHYLREWYNEILNNSKKEFNNEEIYFKIKDLDGDLLKNYFANVYSINFKEFKIILEQNNRDFSNFENIYINTIKYFLSEKIKKNKDVIIDLLQKDVVYNKNNIDEITLISVSKKYGVTKERARQILEEFYHKIYIYIIKNNYKNVNFEIKTLNKDNFLIKKNKNNKYITIIEQSKL